MGEGKNSFQVNTQTKTSQALFLLVSRHFPPSFPGYILPPLTISTQNSSLGPLIRPPGKRLIRPPPPTAAETNSFSIPWASVASAAVGLGDWEATEPHSAEVPAARAGLYTQRREKDASGSLPARRPRKTPRQCKDNAERRFVSGNGGRRGLPPPGCQLCQLSGACEMAGDPEQQGGAGLRRRPGSLCPPAGSCEGTRFPFCIKRVFPFFPVWLTEGF